jgi:hypothetical protein
MPFTGYYTSADASGPDARWSVYREQYATENLEVPVEGSQEFVASCRDEATADLIAQLLQERPEDLAEFPTAPPPAPRTYVAGVLQPQDPYAELHERARYW